jgi:hypothetical protein
VEDALRAAVAAALSTQPSETLAELVLRFSAPPSATPYRNAPTGPAGSPEALRGALLEYLDASGNDGLARAMADVELTMSGAGKGAPELRLRWPCAQAARPLAAPETTAILTRALRDLLGDGRVRIVVGA